MGGKWRLKMAKFHHINIWNCQRIKHLKLTKIAKNSHGFPKFYTHLPVSTHSSIYECRMLFLSICCLGSHFLQIYFMVLWNSWARKGTCYHAWEPVWFLEPTWWKKSTNSLSCLIFTSMLWHVWMCSLCSLVCIHMLSLSCACTYTYTIKIYFKNHFILY